MLAGGVGTRCRVGGVGGGGTAEYAQTCFQIKTQERMTTNGAEVGVEKDYISRVLQPFSFALTD